jgi:predicted metalloprotease with PDZ domain
MCNRLSALLAAALLTAPAPAQGISITLAADLTDAPRKMLHATETLPVQAGELTLLYPKWIPGEHTPTGPIDNQAGLIISTPAGQRVAWRRDSVDMFAYHLTVPAGITQLVIKMDMLATASATGYSGGASTTANLADLSWNQLVLTPQGVKPADVQVTASLKLPAGWKFGTALEETSYPGAPVAVFKQVALDQLVDSPVLTGRFFREVRLADDIMPKHYLDMAADAPEDLDLSQEKIDSFNKLVRETGALYKSRHYNSYHFLVTLSDQVAHFGLEHHQSSDDRVYERTFIDDGMFAANGLLLPHEFTHSWNGKYRRPVGLATGDYETPMRGDMLWVYEGLTEYLGDVLTARSGIWEPSVYVDRLADTLGYLNDVRPGRTWRNLQDTATAVQLLDNYSQNSAYDNWRRDVDYYDEGELLWLEVDLTIRAKSADKKSLNDFAAAFFGVGGDTGPKVVPYTFDDLVAALNAVVPNDWAAFLRKRLDANTATAPELEGINALSGYKLTLASAPNYWTQLTEGQSAAVDTMYSLGMSIGGDGRISDVVVGGVADKAGFGPGMRIVAVNGRGFGPLYLRRALQDSSGKGPAMEFIVENTGYYKVIRVEYHDGEKYPALQKVKGVPTRLDDIVKPMTK